MEEMMDEARRDILDNRVSAYAAAEQLVAKALGTEYGRGVVSIYRWRVTSIHR